MDKFEEKRQEIIDDMKKHLVSFDDYMREELGMTEDEFWTRLHEAVTTRLAEKKKEESSEQI